MKYRNLKTGAVIDVVSKVSGTEWEPIGVPAPKPADAISEDKNRKRKKKAAGNE